MEKEFKLDELKEQMKTKSNVMQKELEMRKSIEAGTYTSNRNVTYFALPWQ